jgi:nucleotide-binding universal stress UspA family protein
MYQRIMVAIDGSETSELGLQEAIKLALDQKAKLAVVHVVDLVIGYGAGQFIGGYLDATREFARSVVSRAQETARTGGVEAEMLSPEIMTAGYHVADTIAQQASEWKADLLVVGTHGRRGVSRMLIGSVAERVVRVAPCALLLVRGDGKLS